jgi:hypothetical protein
MENNQERIAAVIKMPPNTFADHYDTTKVQVLYLYLQSCGDSFGALVIERGRVKSLFGEEWWGCYDHPYLTKKTKKND